MYVFRNYAPTVYVQLEAAQKFGCQQVLWLYGDEQLITEVGTMNVFVFWINENGGLVLWDHLNLINHYGIPNKSLQAAVCFYKFPY